MCVGSNPSPVKFCVQKGNILIEAVSNPNPVKFCVQKANILVEAVVLRVKWEARQTDFTLQEGVIEDRMKQVRYTQGRMAERSKATDSRNSPLRLLGHECVRGFESHSCQNLRSKRQHFNQSRIESHSCQILRSKSQHFGRSSISEKQIKSKTKQISHYKKVLSKQVRYTQARMAEKSKAPESGNTPLRLLVHECVRGFESHSCQILRSKSQHFGRNSISESQIKSKTKQISHYKKVLSKTGWSKCDILKAGWPSGLRRQTREILL